MESHEAIALALGHGAVSVRHSNATDARMLSEGPIEAVVLQVDELFAVLSEVERLGERKGMDRCVEYCYASGSGATALGLQKLIETPS